MTRVITAAALIIVAVLVLLALIISGMVFPAGTS